MKSALLVLLLAVAVLASFASANWLDELEERIVEEQSSDLLDERNIDSDDDELEDLKRAIRIQRNKDYLTAQKYKIFNSQLI